MTVDAEAVLLDLLEAQEAGDTDRMEQIRAKLTPGDVDVVLAVAVGELVDRTLAEIEQDTNR